MLTVSRSSLSIILASCLLASGCNAAKQLQKSLGELEIVRTELISKFGEQNVDIRLNNFQNLTSIAVVYTNSPLNQKSGEERAKRAQATAGIVRQLYPSIKNVSQIWIMFTRVTTRLVIFNYSEMLDSHGFDNQARALAGAAALDSSQPGVYYRASQNQTDIAGGNIQLEGTPDMGVTMIPHFSVVGDVNKITPKPPDKVALDFAAFSEKPRFPNITTLGFYADEKIVYHTEVQFSTSKVSENLYSEFLYLEVSTAVFLKIASGSVIKIRLNEREYTLTETQNLKIQRMADYLR